MDAERSRRRGAGQEGVQGRWRAQGGNRGINTPFSSSGPSLTVLPMPPSGKPEAKAAQLLLSQGARRLVEKV